VGLRLMVIACLVAIFRLWGGELKKWGYAYLAWIEHLGTWGGPLMFLFIATIFSGVSPTGYFPSVAAGATFDYPISIPLSYACTLLGALLNLFLVRYLWEKVHGWIHYVMDRHNWKHRKKVRAGWTAGLVDALHKHPLRMTILVRLPFLGNGAFNYLLSLTKIPAGPMMIGNAIGMLPGSILFAVMGTQIRSLAGMIADGYASTNAIVIMVVLFVVTAVSLVGVILTTRRVMRTVIQEPGPPAKVPEGLGLLEEKPNDKTSPAVVAEQIVP